MRTEGGEGTGTDNEDGRREGGRGQGRIMRMEGGKGTGTDNEDGGRGGNRDR